MKPLIFTVLLVSPWAMADLKSIQDYEHKVPLAREAYLKEFADVHDGVPIKQFFKNRDDKEDLKKCREDLKVVGKEYWTFYEQHKFLEMDEIRVKFTLLLNQCGHCVTKVTRDPQVKTIYLAHGSCYVPGTPKQQADGQKTAHAFLLNMKSYPVRENGFRYLVAFDGIDPTTGKKLGDADSVITKERFLAFIAVRGPANYAFSYFSESYFWDRPYKHGDNSDGSELILQFKSVIPPDKFEAPKLFDYPPSGALANFPMPLRDVVAVRGQWYVDDQGYLNYLTEADFGRWGNINLAWYAQMVSQDTVWTLSARMFPGQVKAYYY